MDSLVGHTVIIAVTLPDGETVDVEVDDQKFAAARAVWEAKGQTFEEAFFEYLQGVLDEHPIIAQGKGPPS